MKLTQSRIYAEDVRKMAKNLMKGDATADHSDTEAGFGDRFEGFTDANTSDQKHESIINHQAQVQQIPPAAASALTDVVATETTHPVFVKNSSATTEGVPISIEENEPPLTQAPEAGPIEPVRPKPKAPFYDSPFGVAGSQHPTQATPFSAEPEPATPDFIQAKPPEPIFQNANSTPAQNDLNMRGPFLSRLRQFSAELRRDFGSNGLFLIDSQEQTLLDEIKNPELIHAARILANATYTASNQANGSADVENLRMKIGTSATLEVIPVHSRYGLLILGVIFPAPLGSARLRQISDLLHKTVEP